MVYLDALLAAPFVYEVLSLDHFLLVLEKFEQAEHDHLCEPISGLKTDYSLRDLAAPCQLRHQMLSQLPQYRRRL